MGMAATFVAVTVVVIVLTGLAFYASIGSAGRASQGSTMPEATMIHVTTTSATPTATTTANQPRTVFETMPDGVGSTQSSNFQPGTLALVIGVNNTVMWANGYSAP